MAKTALKNLKKRRKNATSWWPSSLQIEYTEDKSPQLPSSLQIPQLDSIKSDFHAIFIGKYSFYNIVLYNIKSYCISLVLSFDLFGNVGKQV